MLTQIIGYQFNSGVSKAGNSYSIARIICLAPLAEDASGGVSVGFGSVEYRTTKDVIDKLPKQVPFMAELNVKSELVYGQLRQTVTGFTPSK